MSGQHYPAIRQPETKVENVKAISTAQDSQRSEPMNGKISRLIYITSNNPAGVFTFLKSQNVPVKPTFAGTLKGAKAYLRHEGDAGFMKLVAAAHPDRKILLKSTGHEESGMCGSSSFNGEDSGAQELEGQANELENKIKERERSKATMRFGSEEGMRQYDAKTDGMKSALAKIKEALSALTEKAKSVGGTLVEQFTDEKKRGSVYKWVAIITIFLLVLVIITRKRKAA